MVATSVDDRFASMSPRSEARAAMVVVAVAAVAHTAVGAGVVVAEAVDVGDSPAAADARHPGTSVRVG